MRLYRDGEGQVVDFDRVVALSRWKDPYFGEDIPTTTLYFRGGGQLKVAVTLDRALELWSGDNWVGVRTGADEDE